MQYKCKYQSLTKLAVSPKGFISPLCNNCKTVDCSNPIEKRKVSYLGINKEMRVYVRGDEFSFVIFCEGYTHE